MLKYAHSYESISGSRLRIFNFILSLHLILLKMLLILAQLSLFIFRA